MLKLYALIDKSLERNQKAVQAGHAVAKYASKHPEINWDEQYFVYLDATQLQLKKTMLELDMSNIEYATFIEPDYNNMLTTVVCIPPDNIEFSKMYKKFNCMKG